MTITRVLDRLIHLLVEVPTFHIPLLGECTKSTLKMQTNPPSQQLGKKFKAADHTVTPWSKCKINITESKYLMGKRLTLSLSPDTSSAPCVKAVGVFYTKQSVRGAVFPVSEQVVSGRELPNSWVLITLKRTLARSVRRLKTAAALGCGKVRHSHFRGTSAAKTSSLKQLSLQGLRQWPQSHNFRLST